MATIHPIQTGSLRIRRAQFERRPGGPVRVLLDTEWTDWLPIYAWVIEHPEGIMLVDTGETAQTQEPDYFPSWHPYYRRCVEMDVARDEEIGPQLRSLGIPPDDVQTVVLTHLHTDHTGGLDYFRNSQILVSAGDYLRARGLLAKPFGYMPEHWPSWFRPEPIRFTKEPVGPFRRSLSLTEAGDVVIVPTPGHTPGHVSVIVQTDEVDFFLAGDASYTQHALRWRIPDGISLGPSRMMSTHEHILLYAVAHPTVYLPSHDPEAAGRLQRREVLPAVPEELA